MDLTTDPMTQTDIEKRAEELAEMQNPMPPWDERLFEGREGRIGMHEGYEEALLEDLPLHAECLRLLRIMLEWASLLEEDAPEVDAIAVQVRKLQERLGVKPA